MTTQTYGIGVESLLVILEWGSIPCGALLTCCVYIVCGSTYSLRCLAHCVVFTRHATIRSSHNSITVTILGSRYDLSQFYFNTNLNIFNFQDFRCTCRSDIFKWFNKRTTKWGILLILLVILNLANFCIHDVDYFLFKISFPFFFIYMNSAISKI